MKDHIDEYLNPRKLLDLIKENSALSFLVLTEDKKIEFIEDKNILDCLKLSKNELKGKELHKIVYNEDIQKLETILNSGLRKNHKENRIRIQSTDKSCIWFEILVVKIIGGEEVKKILLILENINKNIKFKSRYKRYKASMDGAIDGMAILNSDGSLIYTNQSFSEIHGFNSHEELVGKSWKQLYNKKEIKWLENEIFSKLNHLKKWHGEVVGKKKDGTQFHQELSLNLLPNNEINVVVRDIDLRKMRQQLLAESEQEYRLITENANDFVYIINKDFQFEFINEPVFQKIMGYTEKEIIGKSVVKTTHPEDKNKSLKALNKIFEQKIGKEVKYEVRDIDKSGQYHWLEIRGKTFEGQDGEAKALLIGRDITERVNTENKLKKSEKNFKNAYNLVNFYQDLLAHDMNNVLQAIISSLELFEILQNTSQNQKELTKIALTMKEQAKRGVNLISKVRKLAKLEHKQISLEPTKLSNALNEAIDATYKAFPKKNINVILQKFDESIRVRANELLVEVFQNILNNAVKYNDNEIPKVKIQVSRTKKDDKIHIKVEFKDNGIGILDQRKGHIFQRQSFKEKSRKGMGMGLSLIKTIVEKYQGDIWVENREEKDYQKGSNFIVTLRQHN